MHVELALSATDPAWTVFRLASGAANHVSSAAAHDAQGDVPIDVTDTSPGVTITLGRAPSGPLLLSYDIPADGDVPPDDPRWG